MHSWNTFGAWTNHGHTPTHKTHNGSNLGETTTFPFIVFFMSNHGVAHKCYFSRDSQVESPEIGTLATFEAHNFL
jgi:hypothetical protein